MKTSNFNLETAIKHWRRQLAANPSLEEGFIAELECHLRDRMEEMIQQGMPAETAFVRAVAALGGAAGAGAEFHKVYTTRRNGRPSWQPPRFMPALWWNFQKTALRNLRRYRMFSFINIFGLAAGMACCMMILLWVQDETGYDRFHKNAGRIQRVIVEHTTHVTYRTPVTPPAMGPALRQDFPEIAGYVRFRNVSRPFRYGKDHDRIYQEQGIIADPSFFRIFTFPLLAGDAATALRDPSSMVISATMARTCFGNEDPLGREMLYNGETPVKITGVMQDVPANSSHQFSFVLPLAFGGQRGHNLDSWTSSQFFLYIQLEPDSDAREVNRKIENVYFKHNPDHRSKVCLIPLEELHLHGYDGSGPIGTVYLFSAVACFVLLIACINFVNLTTARSTQRAREVGLRKAIGARRSDLVKQFMGETFFHALGAFALAAVLVLLLLPAFNQLAGKSIGRESLLSGSVLPGIIGIGLVSAVLAGVYPALFLSGFQPARIFRGSIYDACRRPVFRRLLVVVQFALSGILLLFTLAVARQLDFIQNRDIGFDKKNLLLTGLGDHTPQSFEALKTDLLKCPAITGVTRTNAPLTWLGIETRMVTWEGKPADRQMSIQIRTVDYDYLTTMGMHMREGRFFSREFTTDAPAGYILNEAAVRAMGLTEPVGKTFKLQDRPGRIIGIVRDFNHHSVHDPVEPLVFLMDDNDANYMFLRLKPGRTGEALAALQARWERIDPGYPFEYEIFEDRLSALYRSEQQTGEVIGTFSLLALLIACLGLFGLASFMAAQKTKEIGIRRVLGASIVRIACGLNGEFLKWVAVANLAALPAGAWLIHRWLQNFAFRTGIGPDLFVLTVVLSLGIAGLTVSYTSYQAGRANPVQSLKSE